MSSRIKNGQFIELGSEKKSLNKIVILIRSYSSHVVSFYKNQGCIVGYDIADMPVGDAIFRKKEIDSLRDYVHDECDFFIVNNSLAKSSAQVYTKKPVYVIPHHTTNFESVKNHFNKKPKIVGYVGLPEQLSAVSEIEKLCLSQGASFISVHPNTREECDNFFRQIDIGVIFAEHNEKMDQNIIDLIKSYKPNTKLSNFQSYGIPCVCTPYESYYQFGENACVFANDKSNFLKNLEFLLSEQSLSFREELSNRSFDVGKKFHIDEIKKLYESLAQEQLK